MTPIDAPLDLGVVELVRDLRSMGYDTFSSCEGGEGHAFKYPTVLIQMSGQPSAMMNGVSKLLLSRGYIGFKVKLVMTYHDNEKPFAYIEVEFTVDKAKMKRRKRK